MQIVIVLKCDTNQCVQLLILKYVPPFLVPKRGDLRRSDMRLRGLFGNRSPVREPLGRGSGNGRGFQIHDRREVSCGR
jgi:hypothetical protein